MSGIKAEIKKLGTLLEQNLNIPNYQRPYRWKEKNVRLLLEDIQTSWHAGKGAYRIGSVILHKDGEVLQIVDGQQRITTILLLLRQLDESMCANLRGRLSFPHAEARKTIQLNNGFINRWVAENAGNEKASLLHYLLHSCEFVEIAVERLSEAFQMFDSQNGRGKELEAYNLLKAYHIRAMEGDSFEEKKICDQRWESATRFQIPGKDAQDMLKQVINEQLYRTREWSRMSVADEFDKEKIGVFKGISLRPGTLPAYAWQNSFLFQAAMQQYLKTNGLAVAGLKSRFINGDPESVNPFVAINQEIINGKSFFDYVETYVSLYFQLFVSTNDHVLSSFKKFYKKYCVEYPGANRAGDRYLLELYKSLALLLFDRFGEEGLNKFYETCYLLVYRMRLEYFAVRYDRVAQTPVANEAFYIIQNAKTLADLAPLKKRAWEDVAYIRPEKEIMSYFQSMGVKLKEKNK